MYFIEEELPIDKVERITRRLLINSLKSGKRQTTMFNNLTGKHSKPFIGVANRKNILPSTLDKEEDKQIIADANILYSTKEENPKVLIYLEKDKVAQMEDNQLYDFVEAILEKNLFKTKEYSMQVLNSDMTGFEPLYWAGQDITPAEFDDEDSGSGECAVGPEDDDGDEDGKKNKMVSTEDIMNDIAKEQKEKNKEEISKLDVDMTPKKTEEVIASLTNLKNPVNGDPKHFVSSKPAKMTDKDIMTITTIQDILEQSMRFDGTGKSKTPVPSKRLNMKAVVTEASDNEFVGKRLGEGKKVRLMITVDRSGSMSGYPTKTSNILLCALNNIVLDNPELEIEVMLSYTGAVLKFELPLGGKYSQELWALSKTGDAEYIWQNMEKNIESIVKADINLVFTDGSLVDDPVDKQYLHTRDVFTTGLYVSDAMDIEDIRQHYNRNKQYFDHVIIRKSVEELAEEIAEKIFIERSGR